MAANNDTLRFVQFMHPGSEHKPVTGTIWNTNDHKRKFMKNRGCYLDGRTESEIEDELVFWGEWEPQADLLKEYTSPIAPGYPHYLYAPYYDLSALAAPAPSGKHYQNTDPFVFGDCFHYTYCHQPTMGSLRYLQQDLLIVFGSCLNHQFVIDSVFVVDGQSLDFYSDRVTLQDMKGSGPHTYWDVTLSRITEECDLRLYSGVRYQDRHQHQEMFSFFPCIPIDQGVESGFPRPTINLPDYISRQLNMGAKINLCPKKDDVVKIWTNIRKQVLCQDLSLGISTMLPPQRGKHHVPNPVEPGPKSC